MQKRFRKIKIFTFLKPISFIVMLASGMLFWAAEIWITAECMRIWSALNCSAGDMTCMWGNYTKKRLILWRREGVKKYISRSVIILRIRKLLRENAPHYCRSGMLIPRRSSPGHGIPDIAARVLRFII